MGDFEDEINRAAKKEWERVVSVVHQRTSWKPVPEVLRAFETEGFTNKDGDLLEIAEAISRGDDLNIIWGDSQ